MLVVSFVVCVGRSVEARAWKLREGDSALMLSDISSAGELRRSLQAEQRNAEVHRANKRSSFGVNLIITISGADVRFAAGREM